MQTIQQLTFNSGDDRDPSVLGDVLVFSRLEPARQDEDRCIAFMPVAGGTLTRQVCAGGGGPDNVRDAWLRPVVSPDGERIAYVAEESNAAFVPNVPSTRSLVVASLTDFQSLKTLAPFSVRTADGVINDFRDIEWSDANTIRFIGGTGGFNSSIQDTVFSGLGVFEWNVDAGSTIKIAGIENPIAYTSADDDGIWFLSDAAPTKVFHLPARETTAVELPFDWSQISLIPGVMWDIDNFDGKPAVIARIVQEVGPEERVIVLEIGSGSGSTVLRASRIRNFVKVPGQRAIVAEVVNVTGGANLWLAELP
ncbi:MAG: hypothetical protein IH877_01805 [Gemmatimonadetes bacterium]|nr:hypothetical protein [Gemmatimonadota bacterium]